MKNILLAYLLISFSNLVFGQKLISGEYEFGMNLSYDESSKMLTGYFENYTGLDEETNNPKFSCIFYIEGKVTGKKFSVKTYYPENKGDDVILGTIEIINNKTIKIKLPEERGGCWNVQHFADKPEQFELEKKSNWIQVRYVNKNKSFFFKENSNLSKTKMYLIKNNIVYVEKIENGKAYCSYKGKKIIKGWINIKDLNKL